jgi:hypothetical protein
MFRFIGIFFFSNRRKEGGLQEDRKGACHVQTYCDKRDFWFLCVCVCVCVYFMRYINLPYVHVCVCASACVCILSS